MESVAASQDLKAYQCSVCHELLFYVPSEDRKNWVVDPYAEQVEKIFRRIQSQAQLTPGCVKYNPDYVVGSTVCGHTFHYKCLQEWVNAQRNRQYLECGGCSSQIGKRSNSIVKVMLINYRSKEDKPELVPACINIDPQDDKDVVELQIRLSLLEALDKKYQEFYFEVSDCSLISPPNPNDPFWYIVAKLVFIAVVGFFRLLVIMAVAAFYLVVKLISYPFASYLNRPYVVFLPIEQRI